MVAVFMVVLSVDFAYVMVHSDGILERLIELKFIVVPLPDASSVREAEVLYDVRAFEMVVANFVNSL